MIDHNTPSDAPIDPGPPSCVRCNGSGKEPDNVPDGTLGAIVQTKPSNGQASGSEAGDGGENGAAINGTPNSAHGKMGKAVCGRRTKACSKCGRKYSKDEYEILECPNCENPRPCQRAPVMFAPIGSPCKYHGGMSIPAGPLHPSWKGGRYSKVMPPHMTESYDAAMKDEDLLSIREEIGLYNAMIVERVSRLNKLEASSKLWAELQKCGKNLEAARLSGDTDKMAKLLGRQAKLIRDGAEVGQLYREIEQSCQGKGKLTTREFHRLRDTHQLMTTERCTQIIVSLAKSVREHVTDPAQVRQIAYDFSLLLGPDGGGPSTVDAEFVEVSDNGD